MEGKKFTAPKKQFKTTNGTPETPAGFTAKITGSNAQLDWESVQCATGFKIYKVRLQGDWTGCRTGNGGKLSNS